MFDARVCCSFSLPAKSCCSFCQNMRAHLVCDTNGSVLKLIFKNALNWVKKTSRSIKLMTIMMIIEAFKAASLTFRHEMAQANQVAHPHPALPFFLPQLQSMYVDKLDFNDLHTLVSSFGFQHVARHDEVSVVLCVHSKPVQDSTILLQRKRDRSIVPVAVMSSIPL